MADESQELLSEELYREFRRLARESSEYPCRENSEALMAFSAWIRKNPQGKLADYPRPW